MRMRMRVRARVGGWVCVYLCVYIYVCTYVCMCDTVYVGVCVCVCVCARVRVCCVFQRRRDIKKNIFLVGGGGIRGREEYCLQTFQLGKCHDNKISNVQI